MKYIQLDPEEKQILEDYDKGEFKSIKNLEQEKKLYQEYAKNTLNKLKNINIRISMRDLAKLKARSVETGLPYQTLAAAVLRQYIDRKITLTL